MSLGLLQAVRLCWDKRKVSGRAFAELGLRGGEGFAFLVGRAYDRGLRRVGYVQADGHISAISETADSVVRGRLHTVRVTAVTMRRIRRCIRRPTTNRGECYSKADEGGLAQRCSSGGSENREMVRRAPPVTCMELCTLECPWVT